jgi:thiol:disulfide interchange protein DsbD
MRSVLLLLLCFIAPASNAAGILDRLGGAKQPVFLPPDQAFALDVSVRDAHTLQANFTITHGYYLYRDKISFTTDDKEISITALNLPKG